MMAAPAPEAISFAITGPIARDDLPGLSARVCALLEASSAGVALCDVTESGSTRSRSTRSRVSSSQRSAEAAACGFAMRRRELRELVAFMGLADVLPD